MSEEKILPTEEVDIFQSMMHTIKEEFDEINSSFILESVGKLLSSGLDDIIRKSSLSGPTVNKNLVKDIYSRSIDNVMDYMRNFVFLIEQNSIRLAVDRIKEKIGENINKENKDTINFVSYIYDDEFVALINSLSSAIKDFFKNSRTSFSTLKSSSDSVVDQILHGKSSVSDILLTFNSIFSKSKVPTSKDSLKEKATKDKINSLLVRLDAVGEIRNSIMKNVKNLEQNCAKFYEEAKVIFKKMKKTRSDKLEEIQNGVLSGNLAEIQNMNNAFKINNNEKEMFYNPSSNLASYGLNSQVRASNTNSKSNLNLNNAPNIPRTKGSLSINPQDSNNINLIRNQNLNSRYNSNSPSMRSVKDSSQNYLSNQNLNSIRANSAQRNEKNLNESLSDPKKLKGETNKNPNFGNMKSYNALEVMEKEEKVINERIDTFKKRNQDLLNELTDLKQKLVDVKFENICLKDKLEKKPINKENTPDAYENYDKYGSLNREKLHADQINSKKSNSVDNKKSKVLNNQGKVEPPKAINTSNNNNNHYNNNYYSENNNSSNYNTISNFRLKTEGNINEKKQELSDYHDQIFKQDSKKLDSRTSKTSLSNVPTNIPSEKKLASMVINFLNSLAELQEALSKKVPNAQELKRSFEMKKREVYKYAENLQNNDFPSNTNSISEIVRIKSSKPKTTPQNTNNNSIADSDCSKRGTFNHLETSENMQIIEKNLKLEIEAKNEELKNLNKIILENKQKIENLELKIKEEKAISFFAEEKIKEEKQKNLVLDENYMNTKKLYEEKLNKASEELKIYRGEVSKNKQSEELYKSKIIKLEEEIANNNEEISKSDLSIKLLMNKVKTIQEEKENEVRNMRTKLKDLEEAREKEINQIKSDSQYQNDQESIYKKLTNELKNENLLIKIELDEIKSKLNNAEDEKKLLTEEKNTLTGDKARLLAENRDLKESVKNYKHELNNNINNIKDIKKINELENELDETKKTIIVVKSDYSKLNKEKENLIKELEIFKELNETHQNELLKEKTLNCENWATIEAMKNKERSYLEEVENLKNSIQDYKSNLETEKENFKTKLNELYNTNEILLLETNSFKKEKEKLYSSIQHLENEKLSFQNDIENLKEKLKQEKNIISNLEKENSTRKDDYDNLSHLNDTLTKKIESLSLSQDEYLKILNKEKNDYIDNLKDSFNKDYEILKNKYDQTEASYNEIMVTKEKLATENQTMKSELFNLNHLKEKLNKLEDELEEMRKVNQDIKSENMLHMKEKLEFSNKLKNLEKEQKEMRRSNQILSKEVKEAELALEKELELCAEAEKAKKNLNKEKEELLHTISLLKEENLTINNTHDRLNLDINILKDELTQLNKKYLNEAESLKNVKMINENLQKTNENQTKEILNLKTLNETQNLQILDLENKNKELTSLIESYKESYENQTKEIQNLKTLQNLELENKNKEIQTLNSKLDLLQKRIDNSNTDSAQLSLKLETQNKQLERRSSELEVLKNEIDNKNSQDKKRITELEILINSGKIEIDSLKNDIIILTREKEEIHTKYTEKSNINLKIISDLQILEKEYKDFKEEHHKIISKNNKEIDLNIEKLRLSEQNLITSKEKFLESIKALENEVQSLKNERDKILDSKLKLTESNESNQNKIRVLTDEVSSLQSLKEKLLESENIQKDLWTTNKSLLGEVQDLKKNESHSEIFEKKIQDLTEKFKDADNKNITLKQKVTDYETKMEKFHSEIFDFKKSYDETIEEKKKLEELFKETEDKLNSINSQLTEKIQDNKELKNKISQFKQEFTSMAEEKNLEIENLKEINEDMLKAFNTIKQKLYSILTGVENGKIFSEEENTLEQIFSYIDETKDKISEQNKMINEYEDERKTIEKKLEELNQATDSKMKKLLVASEKIPSNEDKKSVVKNESNFTPTVHISKALDLLSNYNEDLFNINLQLEEKLTRTKEKAKKYKEMLTNLNEKDKEIHDLLSIQDELVQKLSRKEEEISKLKYEIDKAKKGTDTNPNNSLSSINSKKKESLDFKNLNKENNQSIPLEKYDKLLNTLIDEQEKLRQASQIIEKMRNENEGLKLVIEQNRSKIEKAGASFSDIKDEKSNNSKFLDEEINVDEIFSDGDKHNFSDLSIKEGSLAPDNNKKSDNTIKNTQNNIQNTQNEAESVQGGARISQMSLSKRNNTQGSSYRENVKGLEDNEKLLTDQLKSIKDELKDTRHQRDVFKRKYEEAVTLQDGKKTEIVSILKQAFEKLVFEISLSGKVKEYVIVILKILDYDENDISRVIKKEKKGFLGLFTKK